jgi:hypothetical protein
MFTALKTAILINFISKKLWQKHPKMHKMKNQKPLSEHQKRRLRDAISALQNPIFSTLIIRHLH